ncbi:MAG: triosephosphate isomerase [Candidatus Tyloplasma litorale]|nr:MAG: triosephosphate isomerase [Mycoplasmatales bacterium]
MRRPIIVGNWKMNNGPTEARAFFDKFIELKSEYEKNGKEIEVDWAIAAPYISMISLMDEDDAKYIPLAAQNVNENKSGAYTGEISIPMLQEFGVEYVIIGHSERREMYNETNASVNAKVLAVTKTLDSEDDDYIIPIVAFGETEAEFESDRTLEVIETQLKECLVGLNPEHMKEVVLAYEPIWAIGTGKTATPDQAQKVIKASREVIAEMYGDEIAKEVRIQYGGSMKPENVKDLMKQPDIDGGLVGGASLDPESFFQLLTYNK